MYAKLLRVAKMESLTTEWLPCLFPGQGGKDRDFSRIPRPPGNKNGVIMKWKAPHYPGHPLRGRGGGVSNDWCINPLFKFMRKTPICFSITSNASTKNDIEIRFPKWCENETRKTKFKSVFKVMRKRKTKTEIQIPFSKCGENEKRKTKFKSVFQCHK